MFLSANAPKVIYLVIASLSSFYSYSNGRKFTFLRKNLAWRFLEITAELEYDIITYIPSSDKYWHAQESFGCVASLNIDFSERKANRRVRKSQKNN